MFRLQHASPDGRDSPMPTEESPLPHYSNKMEITDCIQQKIVYSIENRDGGTQQSLASQCMDELQDGNACRANNNELLHIDTQQD